LYVYGMLKLKHTGNYRLSDKKIRGVVEKILGKKVHFNASRTGDAYGLYLAMSYFHMNSGPHTSYTQWLLWYVQTLLTSRRLY
jgi:hypothetical protein